MNPNSSYYLSFNVGYPNAYDRALGHTGGTIMVHGVCSSAGCFSMTDGRSARSTRSSARAQRRPAAIQMQSYPFHMTAENLAKHRLDPNIAFWKQLKEGNDHFEVTKQEPTVGVCGKPLCLQRHARQRPALDPARRLPAAEAGSADRRAGRREAGQGRRQNRRTRRERRQADPPRLSGRRPASRIRSTRRRSQPPGGAAAADGDRARRPRAERQGQGRVETRRGQDAGDQNRRATA